ncbi:hypothetical protein R5W24_004368 [Gemmata sp. JC717]|uniref:hypothetical protein n=1 Tax=Gemmata algarum TaxID=2975278 RepID=UPI0021BAB8DE|nr:hypothetical protein [Gemmata algarum]MDY3555229.1 hypothetical protein [Gemmata algarum]
MPGCRSLLVLLAPVALALPACLHVDAHIGPRPVAPPERKAEPAPPAKADPAPQAAVEPARAQFAVLPKVPGEVVRTKPEAPATTSTNTAQKPPEKGPTVPPSIVKTGSGEPAAFPPLTQQLVPPEPPLLSAVRAHCEGRPEQAIEIIRRMEPNQQEFVLGVLPILARGASADLANDPATAAALTDQLRAAASRLEPLAALKIEKVAFCTNEPAGFGRFVHRPPANHYRPNERVHFYLELRNLSHQLTPDGFLTHVHVAAEIRDAKGNVVAQRTTDNSHRVPVVKFENRFVTRSPLQDYYVWYAFSAPPAPGVYTIHVQLSDASGRRTVSTPADRTCEFNVAGP